MNSWLMAFLPQGPVAPRLRAGFGAALGLALAAWLSQALTAGLGLHLPWLFAPLGASAVLVFTVPASPLTQPWSVVAGNTLSALWGIACVNWLGVGVWQAAVAVGGAIVLMSLLRCLHPPGGAAALLVSLLGVANPRFALSPVLLNSVLLVLVGIAYNTLCGHSYPHRVRPPQLPPADLESLNAELDAVLQRHRELLDISRDDLRELIDEAAAAHAARQTKLASGARA